MRIQKYKSSDELESMAQLIADEWHHMDVEISKHFGKDAIILNTDWYGTDEWRDWVSHFYKLTDDFDITMEFYYVETGEEIPILKDAYDRYADVEAVLYY